MASGTLFRDEVDDFVGIGHSSAEEVRDEVDLRSNPKRWSCLPFDRLDVGVPPADVVRVGRQIDEPDAAVLSQSREPMVRR